MSEPIYGMKKILLAIDESVAGIAGVPVAADAVQCDSLSVTKTKTNVVDRKTIRPHFGAGEKITVSEEAQLTFDFALAIGGNVNGVPLPGAVPEYDLVMQACGMARTSSPLAISDVTPANGTLTNIPLAATASAIDDIYNGVSISIESISSTAVAPGSTAKNVFKAAANDVFHAGFLQLESTTTLLNFATTASADDDYYVGMRVSINNQVVTVTDYNGALKQAEIAPALTAEPFSIPYIIEENVGTIQVGSTATQIKLASTASAVDDAYNGLSIVVEGQTKTITDYVGATKTATIAALSAAPFIPVYRIEQQGALIGTPTDTVLKLAVGVSTDDDYYNGMTITVVGQERTVLDYVGATRTVTLSSALSAAPAAGAAYAIVLQTGLLQVGSTVHSLILDSSASASNDAYNGKKFVFNGQTKPIGDYVGATRTVLLGQNLSSAPVITQYQVQATAGDLQQGSTKTSLILESAADATDDFYNGKNIVVNGETKAITDYVGATRTATISALTAFPTKPYSVLKNDDYHVGDKATITHFSGDVQSDVTHTSTVSVVYLPDTVVGDVKGLAIFVSDGLGGGDIRTISSYVVADRKAVLSSALSFSPVGKTFTITETKEVIAYNGLTRVHTLKSALRFVTAAGTPYKISEQRLIVNYNGTTKTASVSPALRKAPQAGALYTINPYIKYSPSSAVGKSLTFYYYEDDVLYKFVYGRGTVSFDFTNGQLAMAKVVMTGIPLEISEESRPAINTDNWVKPLPVNYANTQNLVLHGFEDAVMDKISFDLGNKVIYRNMPGKEAVFITDREVKGQVTIEAVRPSDYDFYADVSNSAIDFVAFTHGPIGNQIAVYCPTTQFSNPSDSDKDGIVMTQFDMTMPALGLGNNEINIILQ
jgi:hypothetical protein